MKEQQIINELDSIIAYADGLKIKAPGLRRKLDVSTDRLPLKGAAYHQRQLPKYWQTDKSLEIEKHRKTGGECKVRKIRYEKFSPPFKNLRKPNILPLIQLVMVPNC